MAVLSPAGQERLFLFGLGVTTCAVVGLMRHLLIRYRDAAIEPPVENKPSYITQQVEDSLKLSTLDKLLYSPNFCIQETAAIIICERALHDKDTINALLWHIAQPDHDLREKGVRTLTMMMNSTTIAMLDKPATYAALVKSLEYSLTDYEHAEHDSEWDNWPMRDVAEQGCLMMLAQLADKCGTDGLVKARFIERWLVKEPWGDEERKRQLNFVDSLRTQSRLTELTLPLVRDLTARRRLCKAKLLPTDFESEPTSRDVRMVNGEGTAGEDVDGMLVEGRRRRDQSSVEESIRRRHREAMVLNDGTRPLGRDDIIQRER